MAFNKLTTLAVVALAAVSSAAADSISVNFDQAGSSSNVLHFNSNVQFSGFSNSSSVPGYSVTLGNGAASENQMYSLSQVQNGLTFQNGANGASFPNGQYTLTISGPFACTDSSFTSCTAVNTQTTSSVSFTVNNGAPAVATTTTTAIPNYVVYQTPTTTTTTTAAVYQIPTPAYQIPTPAYQTPAKPLTVSANSGCLANIASLCPSNTALLQLTSDNAQSIIGALSQSGYTGSYWIGGYNGNSAYNVLNVGQGQIIIDSNASDNFQALCQ